MRFQPIAAYFEIAKVLVFINWLIDYIPKKIDTKSENLDAQGHKYLCSLAWTDSYPFRNC